MVVGSCSAWTESLTRPGRAARHCSDFLDDFVPAVRRWPAMAKASDNIRDRLAALLVNRVAEADPTRQFRSRLSRSSSGVGSVFSQRQPFGGEPGAVGREPLV